MASTLLFDQALTAALTKFGTEAITRMRANLLRRIPKYKGVTPRNVDDIRSELAGLSPSYYTDTNASFDLYGSLRVYTEVTDTEAIMEIYGLEYWPFADRGVRPGEARPTETAIGLWAEQKGVRINPARTARRIARQGTWPTYSFFAQRVFNDIEAREPSLDVQALIIDREIVPNIGGAFFRLQQAGINLVNKGIL